MSRARALSIGRSGCCVICPLIPKDLDRIHGIDERVGTKNYARVVVFYRHLIRTANEDRNKGPESPAPR